MFKHFKLIVSVSILALATSVYVYSQGRTTIDGLNPQLPAALGANGGLKVEGIAAGVAMPENITQVGGVNVSTGIGPAGTGIPRVTTSFDDTSGSVTFSANTACPAASTVVTTSAGCIVIPLAGQSGATVQIQAGTLVATAVYEYSDDGGTTWGGAIIIANAAQNITGLSFNNPAAATDAIYIVGTGWSHVRARVSGGGSASFTSGTAVVVGRATHLISPLAVGAIASGFPTAAVPLFVQLGGLKAQTGVPTAVVNTATVNANGDVFGVQFIRQDHPNRVNCVLTTTNTTSTLITGCSAPGAALSLYLTDISVYGGVAVGATAAATIQSGTGGTCGTGTAINYYCQHVATTGCEANFSTPKKIAANSEVCLVDATVGTKFVTVGGFIAP